MKLYNFRFILILLFAFAISVDAYAQTISNPEITAEEIKEHISFLASDNLKGRDSGTQELFAAAVYISVEFKNYGLEIWEIEFRGSKRAEVEHHSFAIYHYMSQLRDAKLEFVGMSSVGPSIAVVTALDKQAMEKILRPLGLSIAIVTKVDNEGLKIIRKNKK